MKALALLTVALFPASAPSAQLTSAVRIEARRAAEVRASIPGMEIFQVTIKNGTAEPVSLAGYELPGGYAGSGMVFHCVAEKWDGRERRWRVAHEIRSGDYRQFRFVNVLVAAGQDRSVCGEHLQKEEVGGGSCWRFTLRSDWSQSAKEWTSEPLVIGTKRNACSATRGTGAVK